MHTFEWIQLTMRRGAIAIAMVLAATAHAEVYERGGPSTTNNDDTCDVAVLPAATLLLPYFEVDLANRSGATTSFTVTNVGPLEQIAHVTLWTDHAHPVIDFNIFMTGYDVQSVNLYDVLALGQIAPPLGTGFNRPGSPEGEYSTDEDNPDVMERTCRSLPRQLDAGLVRKVQRAFTAGEMDGCRVGAVHANAIGYVTIDVVRRCDNVIATEPRYYSHTLLFDNVLTDDYQQIDHTAGSAQANPLVHIRAVPERGHGLTELPRTFYSSLQNGSRKTRDARQPLPSTFAAHWIGGVDESFRTTLKIWREGSGSAECRTLHARPVAEVVRFDENENFSVDAETLHLPSASMVDATGSDLAALDDAVAGWLYLNLDDGADDAIANQAWVVTSMRSAHAYSVDTDATALGNGCSPAVPGNAAHLSGRPRIEPAPNVNVATTSAPSSLNNDDTCDIAVLPAATLLLPYFEVDLDLHRGLRSTTLFTITNTSPLEQIAQVTLWTDYAYALLTFSVHLTGYDMQSINLYDVLKFGTLAPGRTAAHGDLSRRNGALDLSDCDAMPRQLTPAQIVRLQQAFLRGVATAAGSEPHCANAGYSGKQSATGYATIDVVGSCTTLNPSMPGYYTEAIRFDNVLTGDYQHVDALHTYAQGGSLVHIRAIPEGGDARTRAAGLAAYRVNLPRTFYENYQSGPNKQFDARQPLPSTFAARYIDGVTGSFETTFKIWMQGEAVTCKTAVHNQHLPIADLVTFDEEENAAGSLPPSCPITCPIFSPGFPASGRFAFDGGIFPIVDDTIAGWIYLNLNDDSHATRQRQAWVISSMAAEGRYSVDVDATALGNGCSPAVGDSEASRGAAVIGPAPNVNPR